MPVVTPKTRMKGGDETFVSDPSRFYWVFYAMFFVILYTLGLVALYTTNTELIGFGIFFAIQVLLAGTIRLVLAPPVPVNSMYMFRATPLEPFGMVIVVSVPVDTA